MKHVKGILSLLLVMALSLSMVACNREGDETTQTGEDDYVSAAEASDMVLAFSREDGINPFSATSLMNEPIMPLLYQGLYSMNSSYEPIAELASAATLSGNNLIITVDNTKKFSDGTTVTAEDVVYSYNKAKESAYYQSALSYFGDAEATGTQNVTFELLQTNKLATACLVFPIVKYGTATDSNSIPTGTGLYTYSTSEDGGLLTLREDYKKEYKADQIFLSNTSDTDALVNSLSIGHINVLYDDLASGKVQRATADTIKVPLTNLVYIGFNESTYGWSDLDNRLYLNALIDRASLISSGLDGYGEATTTPFHPNWYLAQNVAGPTGDYQKAKSKLAGIFKDRTVTILTDSSNDFKVKLANALAQQLETAGVSTKVNALSYKKYVSAVKSKSYSLYIGEYKLTNDMNLTKLLSGTGELATTYQGVLSGAASVEDFVSAFYNETPFLPLCYRDGLVNYSKSLQSDPSVLPGNPYSDLPNWEFSE